MGCHACRLSLPGPGAYKAEEGMDIISSHPVAPAFSLAAPWQPLRPTSARPGPGAYRHAHPATAACMQHHYSWHYRHLLDAHACCFSMPAVVELHKHIASLAFASC